MTKYHFKAALFWAINKPLSYLLSYFYNSQNINRRMLYKYNSSRIPGSTSTFCYAPQRNVYFSNNGKVLACCYNKEYPYYSYQNNNLSDILNSSNKKLLEKNLKNNNLSAGCTFCKKSLNTENYNAIGAHQYDMLPINKKYPVMMEFELGNICNLACIMCSPVYSSKLETRKIGTAAKKTIYDKIFVEQLKEYIPYLYKTKFFGGEPFLINIYYEIWETIININPECEIIVQTNATILNDKIKALFKKGNFRLSISIDSLNKENYQFIRKGANFDNVMSNINFFSDYSRENNKPLFFSICPIQQNWKEIPELVDYCNKHKIFLNFNTVTAPYECSIINMSSREILEIKQFYQTRIISTGNFVKRQNKKQFNGLINQISSWYKNACEIEQSKKYYSLETIKEILESKVGKITDKEAYSIFEKIFYTFPSEIELSDYHFNRIKNLKPHSVEKVLMGKSEDVIRMKLNNIFAVRSRN